MDFATNRFIIDYRAYRGIYFDHVNSWSNYDN